MPNGSIENTTVLVVNLKMSVAIGCTTLHLGLGKGLHDFLMYAEDKHRKGMKETQLKNTVLKMKRVFTIKRKS